MKKEPGIYDLLVDERLSDFLACNPEVRSVFAKLDAEEQPSRYASFAYRLLEQVLKQHPEKDRLAICNRVLKVIGESSPDGLESSQLLDQLKDVLIEIKPVNLHLGHLPRPLTSLVESSLFTGSPNEPQLVHELDAEMRSADGVDILVSFVKWSGLRLLAQAFEDLRDRRVPVRLITTSYMGASDAHAIEWLSSLPNVQIRVSYDVTRTRLHAKAYHFKRASGFSTAYVGSANLSNSAITSGLEWNLKVTAEDSRHILEKFVIEFETYWNSEEFLPYTLEDKDRLREALLRARGGGGQNPTVFFDLKPHHFQERILDALQVEREVHGRFRNLVIAATGTGKTVVAAFDFKRFYEKKQRQARLLFVAHRQQILDQARQIFRQVLRDGTFGELLVGSHQPTRRDHLFCSVQMLNSQELWSQLGPAFYEFIVVDEVHHGVAASYRPLFENFEPEILLGLTATPERADRADVSADFDRRFSAEIRLPEALAEKLLCPFHYFGVADPIRIDADSYWRAGKYSATALESVYTAAHALAIQRVDAIIGALGKLCPERERIKAVGFCVSIRHAEYMAQQFERRGIAAAAFVSGVDDEESESMLRKLGSGELKALFTVDRLSEGVDIPEINTVLFLRPTESLTVFLQQLGRGLRHAPEKECLTVIDFVAQAHKSYRYEGKFKALLPTRRLSIDKEVEQNFPHLPSGCSIQLDRVAREHVIENIRQGLANWSARTSEQIRVFEAESGLPLTFGNFVRHNKVDPYRLLRQKTWSEVKAAAFGRADALVADEIYLRRCLQRALDVSGPAELQRLISFVDALIREDSPGALRVAESSANETYFRLLGDRGDRVNSLDNVVSILRGAPSILQDYKEVLTWSLDSSDVAPISVSLPFETKLELHAKYGSTDVLAALGGARIGRGVQRGVGVLSIPAIRAYAMLITFQKSEREFSPSTMYADFPISRTLIHWESPSGTKQDSDLGQNLIHHRDRKVTILLFARERKRIDGVTVPFTYLGPASIVEFESEKPIKMVWRLDHAMPVEIFEDNRKGG